MQQITLIFLIFHLHILCQTDSGSESILTNLISEIQGNIEIQSDIKIVTISFPLHYSELMNIDNNEGEIEVKLFKCQDQFFNCLQLNQRDIISRSTHSSRIWSFYFNQTPIPYLDGTIFQYGYYYYEFSLFNEIQYYIFEFQVQTIKSSKALRSLNFKEIKSESVILSRIDFYQDEECTKRIPDSSISYYDSIKFIKFEILNPNYIDYSQQLLELVIMDGTESHKYTFPEIKEQNQNYTIFAMPNIRYFTKIRVKFRLDKFFHEPLTIYNSRMVSQRVVCSGEICKKRIKISQILFEIAPYGQDDFESELNVYYTQNVYIKIQIIELTFKDYYIVPKYILYIGDGLYIQASIDKNFIIFQGPGTTIFYFQAGFSYQNVQLSIIANIEQYINTQPSIEQVSSLSSYMINFQPAYYANYPYFPVEMYIDFCENEDCETLFTPELLYFNQTVILKLSLNFYIGYEYLDPLLVTFKGNSQCAQIVQFLNVQHNRSFTIIQFEMNFVEPVIKLEVIGVYRSKGFNSTTKWIKGCDKNLCFIGSSSNPCYIFELSLKYQLLLIFLLIMQ